MEILGKLMINAIEHGNIWQLTSLIYHDFSMGMFHSQEWGNPNLWDLTDCLPYLDDIWASLNIRVFKWMHCGFLLQVKAARNTPSVQLGGPRMN